VPIITALIALAATLAAALPCAAQLAGPPDGQPHVRVVRDFIAGYDQAARTNAPLASINLTARSGAVIIPSIMLHPTAQGDSIAAYRSVAVPMLGAGERAFVFSHVAMSDGIAWDGPLKPNGVRFAIAVNGEVLYQEGLAINGWRLRAIELTRWAGQTVTVEFRTNAIDGNVAYDWALLGKPQVIRFFGVPKPEALAPDAMGLAMARVHCTADAHVILSAGEVPNPALLPAGDHWVPVRFTKPCPVTLKVVDGAAELQSVEYAPDEYRIEAHDLAPASPLVTAGRPFTVILPVENTGTGLYPGGEPCVLSVTPLRDAPAVTSPAGFRATLGPVGPGAKQIAAWKGLVAPAPGEWSLRATLGRTVRHLHLSVLPPEPCAGAARPVGPAVSVSPGGPIAAIAASPFSRLSFVLPPGRVGYAIADTWNGLRWQRVGTLFPLARLVVRPAGAGRQELPIAFTSATTAEGTLTLAGAAIGPDGTRWPLRLAVRPLADSPRLLMHWELDAPLTADVLVFVGPTVLAGDRSFGARKQFALFPGVEQLEGDEESSSPRDLAPPLNKREVPLAYKIACPLMAVQGDDALVALLWDMSQRWAPGETRPAARFIAPGVASGSEATHMSLFAPSVGGYVDENTVEARHGYPLPAGGRLVLDAQLVLDHKSRYANDPVVAGPHHGGLVLKAMQHWFDAFGLPEPSPQPRTWATERALSREAYLATLWSADPPGWPPFRGQPVGTETSAFVPLLADLRAGVTPAVRTDIEGRIAKVAKHALGAGGPGALLQGNRVILPYHYGYLAECLAGYRGFAESMLASRENGLWVWRPGDTEHAGLGIPGTHTLGQAAYPSLVALRAARFLGDPGLAKRALEAMRQMDQYEIPRGASMWECPQYQPDIFAAALAVKAYCEAYKLTGDAAYLTHARYWAWTGLPFIYTWSLPGYPTMLGNSVGVIGSTYYSHSWLGRPVVWMGLDYAYALEDLAEFDKAFPWLKVSQSVTNCAMWQQFADGPEKGLFPDSWELATNKPNIPYILPDIILLDEFRLRGVSMEIRHVRLDGRDAPVSLNSGADIADVSGSPATGTLTFALRGGPGLPVFASLAQVAEPKSVEGCGARMGKGEEMQAASAGWQYDAGLKALIVKQTPGQAAAPITVRW
jgi:hypothetical protein